MNVAPLFMCLYIVGYCDMVKLIISRLRGGCQNYIIAKNAVAPYFFAKIQYLVVNGGGGRCKYSTRKLHRKSSFWRIGNPKSSVFELAAGSKTIKTDTFRCKTTVFANLS